MGVKSLTPAENEDLKALSRIVQGHRKRRGSLPPATYWTDLPVLVRRASAILLRLEASGADAATEQRLRRMIAEAHGLRSRHRNRVSESRLTRFIKLLCIETPAALRREWRWILGVALLFYGLAGASYVAVERDLSRAVALLDPAMVEGEIEQLRSLEPGEEFRGNFTFGFGDSPRTAGWILAHNIGVSFLLFAAALLPPIFLLLFCVNATMVGTYLAVASHWNQALAILSRLACHGVLELQCLILAAVAGLILARAWVAPGAKTRRDALAEARRRSRKLLVASTAWLVVAGLIEGFVTPHAPTPARWGVAFLSGLALAFWAGGGLAPAARRLVGSPSARAEPSPQELPAGVRG